MRRPTVVRLALLLLAGHATTLRAQAVGDVETIAGVLAAEDARELDVTLLNRGLTDPDTGVRSLAALAVGRIRDPGGVALLAPLLLDPDSGVQRTAIFALGQLGDTTGEGFLLRRLGQSPALATAGALELITAVARINGPAAPNFFRQVLDGSGTAERSDQRRLLERAAQECWRLGARAPIDQLLGVAADSRDEIRYAAVYSLSRLRPPPAGARLVEALRDPVTLIRSLATRALTRAYADTAGLASASVADLLARGLSDRDPGLRISALRSLGSYHDPRLALRVLPLLEDPVPNVQVQAAQVLGALGGPDASSALQRILAGGKGTFARRREALASLARIDTTAFGTAVIPWEKDADWRARAAAADGWARVRPARVQALLEDRDPRVVAAALQAWGEAVPGPDPAYLAACRKLLASPDAAVRSIAADGMARAPQRSDLAGLEAAVRRAARDSFPEATLSALGAIVALLDSAGTERVGLEREVLVALPAPTSYLVRRWAEERWPAASDLWGPSLPIRGGRTREDYRDIARQFLLSDSPQRAPHVQLDLGTYGMVELELFGADAPLTVAQFLRLVDQHFFDGLRFHRVVPDFVAQAGDPRGDGWGGAPELLRDEINLRRYDGYTLGMALSGRDTGTSQWFITLSPQPHLDGGYTVFGQVVSGQLALSRVTQGDLIRSIRR